VTPETKEHIDKARDYLTKARSLVAVMHYHDEAGRAAYLAERSTYAPAGQHGSRRNALRFSALPL
jgi:hypothetical protein